MDNVLWPRMKKKTRMFSITFTQKSTSDKMGEKIKKEKSKCTNHLMLLSAIFLFQDNSRCIPNLCLSLFFSGGKTMVNSVSFTLDGYKHRI